MNITHAYRTFAAGPARPQPQHLSRLLAALAQTPALSRIRARLAERRALRRIARFSDRRLGDIGFMREWDGEIHRVVADRRG